MPAKDRTEIRESPKAAVIGTLAGWLMRIWSLTLRIEVEDRCGITRPGGFPGPVILALWHNGIFTIPPVWRREIGSHRKAVVLTSASHDGAALARAMAVFGLGAVRGSSSRRGVAALIALKRTLRDGIDVCITPDGPRGPRYGLQPGVVKLAASSGAPVIPIHLRVSSAWRLKTWDRFVVPKPFSRVRVIFDDALVVPPDLPDDRFEAERLRIESILRSPTDDP